MTSREQGYLLLTSHLGDFERENLTMSQYQQLLQSIKALAPQQRIITEETLLSLGYSADFSRQVCHLLSQKKLLNSYLSSAVKSGCYPLLPITEGYPKAVSQKLGLQMPSAIWAKGDPALLRAPMVSLVGSRDLREENENFAYQVGMQAALQGYCLVSGNARGADRVAQNSCLAHGGKVISIVADSLQNCPQEENILYLSENGFEFSFSAHRALSRNRLIHCMGQVVFVAQLQAYRGGTWSGTSANLKNRWSPVFYYDDGSADTAVIAQMGAKGIDCNALHNISALINP